MEGFVKRGRMQSSMELIELENISTIYEGERIPAIRGINLRVRQGEFITIIGPNGAGKTTLLETINGLLRYTNGSLRVFGKDVKKFGDEVRKRIGFIPQSTNFPEGAPYLVEDVVLMGRFGKIGPLRFPRAEDWRKVNEALLLAGVESLRKRPIGKLSGGQQQKVMIARAVAQEPSILLLDEPFSNLDFVARSELLELICNLHRAMGLTTLMVVHDFESIPEICTRILLMREGKIVMDGYPCNVLRPEVLNPIYGLHGLSIAPKSYALPIDQELRPRPQKTGSQKVGSL